MKHGDLSFDSILRAAEQFTQDYPFLRARGRPPSYSEALVLAMRLFRALNRYSWRQIVAIAQQQGISAPSYSTLYYRATRVTEERWKQFLQWVTQHLLQGRPIEALLADSAD